MAVNPDRLDDLLDSYSELPLPPHSVEGDHLA
jgi:hypothetical protein